MASGEATGTATITAAAPAVRAHRQATAALAPVAIPSSTITAVRPWRETGVRPSRRRCARRSNSVRSSRSTATSSLFETRTAAMTSWLRTRTPPSPIAPIASSGLCGLPSLRTTTMSSGAFSAAATSAATGTPPRGSPRTTGLSIRKVSSRPARNLPAEDRSRYWVTALSSRSSNPDQFDATRCRSPRRDCEPPQRESGILLAYLGDASSRNECGGDPDLLAK